MSRTSPHQPIVEPRAETRGDVPPGDRLLSLHRVKDRVDLGRTAIYALIDAVADKAARDSIKATLPADSSGYRDEELILPPGVSFKFDRADPMFGAALKAAADFALKHHFTQDQYSELLGIYAASQAHSTKQFNDAFAAEKTKLGPAGPCRRAGALAQRYDRRQGSQSAAQCMFTEAQVSAFESLLHRTVSQGGASFRQDGRVPPDNSGRVSDAEYRAMTPHQQREYAARFDQSQFQGR